MDLCVSLYWTVQCRWVLPTWFVFVSDYTVSSIGMGKQASKDRSVNLLDRKTEVSERNKNAEVDILKIKQGERGPK
jgi:hypothetical protein